MNNREDPTRTPLTIAYLTNHYGRASDTFIRQEVQQLRRLGHTVHTFSTRRPEVAHEVSDDVKRERQHTLYLVEQGPAKLLGSLLAEAVTRPGRVMRAAKLAWRSRSPGVKALLLQGAYLAEAALLARRLRALRVQILHNHMPMNSATVAMLAAVMADVPFSLTVHGPHIFSEPARWALGTKIERSAFTVCISCFGKSQCMLHSDPSAWPKLHVVRCGLDERFLDAPPTPLPTAPRLVCVGRLCPEKGQLLLVDAVARLRDEGVAIQLLLVGDGPDRQAIEARAAALGCGESVRVLGWASSDVVRDAIVDSRALVLPSFAEGLPVVILEALALHRPVISTYVAGIPELVRPGENGWLVPAGATEPLVDAMRAAVTAEPGELAAMGARGAEAVRRMHCLATEVGKLEALLRASVDPSAAALDPRSSLTTETPTCAASSAPSGT